MSLCDRRIAADEPDQYVSWNQSAQTSEAKAGQHPPTARRTKREQKDHNRARVAGCLEDSGPLTVRELSLRTGLSIERVSTALLVLRNEGHVSRSHRQIDDRSIPVMWQVRQ